MAFVSPLDIQKAWETILSSLQAEKQQKILQIPDFFSLRNTASIDIMKRATKKVHINGISWPIRKLRLYSIPIT
jgi:hypothetical protein